MSSTMSSTMSSPVSSRPIHRARGFGLIEILVAVLIFSFAILALSKFQGDLLKSGSTAKGRSVAAQLVREKIDDLRSYTQLATGGAGLFGYAEIAANAGGRENADGTLVLPNGDITLDSTTYTRSWAVSDYYYCGENSAPTTTVCAGAAPPYPNFKVATVTITWTDTDGTTQSVSDQTAIHSSDPNSTAHSLGGRITSFTPRVPYTPGQRPEVTGTDLGDGLTQETSKPKPSIIKAGSTILNTIAVFDTVTYDTNDGNRTLTREEFATIDCQCELAGQKKAYDVHGIKRTKLVGIPAELAPADFTAIAGESTFELIFHNQLQQHRLCVFCCADHHDYYASADLENSCVPTSDTGKENCFDPFRPSTTLSTVSDYYPAATANVGRDHEHYSKANVATPSASTTNLGDPYYESCRFKRINGSMMVQQDWRMIKLNVFPREALSSTAYEALYSTYVGNVVKNTITGSALPTKPSYTLYSLKPGQTTDYMARGVYLDYLNDAEVASLTTRINASDASVLQDVPFYELNLTKLANWYASTYSDPLPVPPGSPTTQATVTNEAIVAEAENETNYSRGRITISPTATSGSQVTIYAVAKKSNTGILAVYPTDYDDAVAKWDAETFSIDQGFTISGTVTLVGTSASIKLVDTTITPSSGAVCGTVSSAGAYTCTVPGNWTGTLTANHKYNLTATTDSIVFNPSPLVVSTPVNASLTGQNFTGTLTSTAPPVPTTVVVTVNVIDDHDPTLYPESLDRKATSTNMSNSVVTATGGATTVSCTATGYAAYVNAGSPATVTYNCLVPGNWTGSVNVNYAEWKLSTNTALPMSATSAALGPLSADATTSFSTSGCTVVDAVAKTGHCP